MGRSRSNGSFKPDLWPSLAEVLEENKTVTDDIYFKCKVYSQFMKALAMYLTPLGINKISFQAAHN